MTVPAAITGATTHLKPAPSNLPKMGLTKTASPTMTMTAEKSNQVGKWCFATHANGHSQKIDPKRYQKLKKKTIDHLWDSVKTILPPGAKHLRINLSQNHIRYVNANGEPQYIRVGSEFEKQHPEAMKLLERVKESAKSISLFLGTMIAEGASRGDGPKPLEVLSKKWKDLMPTSLADYAHAGHLKTVLQHIEKNQNTDPRLTYAKIVAAEAFLKALKAKADFLRKKKSEFMQNPNFSALSQAERNATQKSISDLQKVDQGLDQIDRFALYTAIAIWGNLDPKQTTKNDRYKKANEACGLASTILSGKLKPGEDTRSFWRKGLEKAGLPGSNKKEGEILLNLKPALSAYAFDLGALLIPENLEYCEHADEQGRSYKGASMTEFLVHSMNHIHDSSFDFSEALDALGWKFDDETKSQLADAAEEAMNGHAKNTSSRTRRIGANVCAQKAGNEAYAMIQKNPLPDWDKGHLYLTKSDFPTLRAVGAE